MGFQFLHIEAYARHGSKQHGQPRKWSAREIAAEAMRASLTPAPVAQPLPPQVLHGCTPAEAAKLAHDWADSSQDAKGRKLRADGLALAAGVVSLPAGSARTGPGSVRRQWRGFGSSTASGCARWWSTQTRRTPICTSTPCLCRGSGSRCFTQDGRPQQKRPAKGPKGRTERRIQAGYGGVAGWLSKGRSGPFWAYAAWPWQAAADAGAWKAEQEQARSLAQPVPAELAITPQDVAKRVTKAGLLGKQYESGEELAARLTELVQERARPLAAQAARAEFDGAQASRLVQRVQVLESTDNTQRAELAERQAQELRRELEAERRKAAKAHELAELYRSGRDQAIDELRAIQPQRGHGLER